MAITTKSSHALMLLVLAFICIASVQIFGMTTLLFSYVFYSSLQYNNIMNYLIYMYKALEPACLGQCDAFKQGCLQLCQGLGFQFGSCKGGKCCCHE